MVSVRATVGDTTPHTGRESFSRSTPSSAGWRTSRPILRHPVPQHGFHRRCHRPGRHRGRSRSREAGAAGQEPFSAAGADHGAARIYQYRSGQERLPVSESTGQYAAAVAAPSCAAATCWGWYSLSQRRIVSRRGGVQAGSSRGGFLGKHMEDLTAKGAGRAMLSRLPLPVYPAARRLHGSAIQDRHPTAVGSTMASSVHRRLRSPGGWVRQVVPQGMCSRHRAIIHRAVSGSSRCAAKWPAAPPARRTPSASRCADSPSAEWAARSHWREKPSRKASSTMPSSPMSRPAGTVPRRPAQQRDAPASMFPIPQISSPAGAVTVSARPSTNTVRSSRSAPAPAPPGAGDRAAAPAKKRRAVLAAPWRSAAWTWPASWPRRTR